MTIFRPNQIVHLDNDVDVMHAIVYVEGDFAWIKPYGTTGKHNHFRHMGSCKCESQEIVHTSRLWLHVWSKMVEQAKER